MARKEIIQALKDNEKPFGRMTKELKDGIKEFWGSDDLEVVRESDGKWGRISVFNESKPTLSITYRLRPDYKDEPEIEKCEVEIDEGHLHFNRGTQRHSLGQAADHVDFIGFLYEDGQVRVTPRVYKLDSGILGHMVPFKDVHRTTTVFTPTHVLFRKETDE